MQQRKFALGVRHGADDGLEVLATDGHVVVQPEVVFGVELVDDLRVDGHKVTASGVVKLSSGWRALWMTVVGRMRLLRSLFFQTATPASCTADVSPNEWNMISSIDWPYPSSSVPMRPSATFSLPVRSQRHAPRGKGRPP